MKECWRIDEIETRLSAVEEKLNKIGVNEGEVMTQSAAAKYLLITRNTLVKHTAMGLVSNIPGTTKYRKSELDKYLAIRQRKK